MKQLKWTTRSRRLQTAEYGDRQFRVEKSGATTGGVGTVILVERDKMNRSVRRQPLMKVVEAKALAEEWLKEEPPTEPIRHKVSPAFAMSNPSGGKQN